MSSTPTLTQTQTHALSYTHKHAYMDTQVHPLTHIHTHKYICSLTPTITIHPHTHILTCTPTYTHTYMYRKDIWFDDVELEIVDGEPVPKRPHVESTRVPLVTGSDKRYIHIVHVCVTSLQLTGYCGS